MIFKFFGKGLYIGVDITQSVFYFVNYYFLYSY